MNKLITLLYRIKAEICLYFDWQPEEFDPEVLNYRVVQQWGGSGWSEYGTAYWHEQFVVGKGWRNWWQVYHGDSSL